MMYTVPYAITDKVVLVVLDFLYCRPRRVVCSHCPLMVNYGTSLQL